MFISFQVMKDLSCFCVLLNALLTLTTLTRNFCTMYFGRCFNVFTIQSVSFKIDQDSIVCKVNNFLNVFRIVKPILNFGIFELNSLFICCELNIPGVIAFYAFPQYLKNHYRWIALSTFRTTGRRLLT